MASELEDAWVARVLGVNVSRAGSPEQALGGWKSARATVVSQLRRLKAAITASKDPEGNPAIILVDAIVKNLTPEPASVNAVKELERYLGTDDIVAIAESPNGFGIPVAIRSTLLPALESLRRSLR